MRLLRRQLLVLEPRQEHRLELEPFRAVERHEVDAACGVAARREPLAQIGDERRRVTVELRGELDEPSEVVLANLLALAELVGTLLDPAGRERFGADRIDSGRRGTLEPPAEPPRRFTVEQRRTLIRDARIMKHLLEVRKPRVRAREDRRFLEQALERTDHRDERRIFRRSVGIRPHDRLGAVGACRVQRLRCTSKSRHERVRELEHLR